MPVRFLLFESNIGSVDFFLHAESLWEKAKIDTKNIFCLWQDEDVVFLNKVLENKSVFTQENLIPLQQPKKCRPLFHVNCMRAFFSSATHRNDQQMQETIGKIQNKIKKANFKNGGPRTSFISLLKRRVQFSMDNVCKVPFRARCRAQARYKADKQHSKNGACGFGGRIFLARKHAKCVCLDTLGLGTFETDVIHWATAFMVSPTAKNSLTIREDSFSAECFSTTRTPTPEVCLNPYISVFDAVSLTMRSRQRKPHTHSNFFVSMKQSKAQKKITDCQKCFRFTWLKD